MPDLKTSVRKLLHRVLPQRMYTSIRQWRKKTIVRRFKPRIIHRKYSGCDLRVCIADPTAELWYDKDWPELPEINLLKEGLLRPGATVFDIGAHQCVMALLLANAVGPTGKVVAVEAMPHNARLAHRNKELNGAEQLTIVEAAAARQSGTAQFSVEWNGHVDNGNASHGSMTVPAVTIDDLAAEHGVPDVLFVDVEGFEVEVLKGAEKTLESEPDVFVEVHAGCGLEEFGGTVEQVATFFPPDRYDLLMLPQEGEPAPYRSDHPIATDRFYLVARALRDAVPVDTAGAKEIAASMSLLPALLAATRWFEAIAAEWAGLGMAAAAMGA